MEKTVNHNSVQIDKLFPLIFLKVLGFSFCSAKFLLQVDHIDKKKGNFDDSLKVSKRVHKVLGEQKLNIHIPVR